MYLCLPVGYISNSEQTPKEFFVFFLNFFVIRVLKFFLGSRTRGGSDFARTVPIASGSVSELAFVKTGSTSFFDTTKDFSAIDFPKFNWQIHFKVDAFSCYITLIDIFLNSLKEQYYVLFSYT